ncbi:unnamed protein product, partial [Choristocarpus tenellus]
LNIVGKRDIKLECVLSGKLETVVFTNVLVVPDLGVNLYSAKACMRDGQSFRSIDSTRISTFKGNGERNLTFTSLGEEELFSLGMRRVGVRNSPDSTNVPTTDATSISGKLSIHLTRKNASMDINEMHVRLGHVHQGMVRKYAPSHNILLTGTWGPFCRGCSLGKGHWHPIPKETENRASEKGGRVSVDLTGPKEHPSKGKGYYYAMFVVDDYTRMSFGYYLRTKSDQTTSSALERFLIDVAKPAEIEIKAVRTDCGKEFTGAAFESMLEKHGI